MSGINHSLTKKHAKGFVAKFLASIKRTKND